MAGRSDCWSWPNCIRSLHSGDTRVGSCVDIPSPEHIRATIAISIVVEYMVLVGVVAFFHWDQPSGETTFIPQVTQTLVTEFHIHRRGRDCFHITSARLPTSRLGRPVAEGEVMSKNLELWCATSHASGGA